MNSLTVNSDGRGPVNKTVVLRAQPPALAIVEYARDHRIDLIVVGTHGRKALAHLMVGSVAERVVRTAPCPVLTVHHPEHEFILPDVLATAEQLKPDLAPRQCS